MKKIIFFLIIIIAIAFVLVAISSSKKSSPNLSDKTQKGVSLSPKSFNGTDFLGFWDKAVEAGTIISWAGEWTDLKKENSAPYVVMALGKQYNLTPVIILSSEINDKENYINTVSKFVSEQKPLYLGLGNEINYVYRNNPSEMDSFVEVFNSIYDEIKKVSPNTSVFTIFQYETPNNALESAAKFSKADMISFTTYPEIDSYLKPSDLPNDYYSKIKNSIEQKVVFTEIGWRGINEDDQAEYITKFSELAEDLKPEFVIWPFVYDPQSVKFFETLGLIDAQGVERKSWTIWKNQSF